MGDACPFPINHLRRRSAVSLQNRLDDDTRRDGGGDAAPPASGHHHIPFPGDPKRATSRWAMPFPSPSTLPACANTTCPIGSSKKTRRVVVSLAPKHCRGEHDFFRTWEAAEQNCRAVSKKLSRSRTSLTWEEANCHETQRPMILLSHGVTQYGCTEFVVRDGVKQCTRAIFVASGSVDHLPRFMLLRRPLAPPSRTDSRSYCI